MRTSLRRLVLFAVSVWLVAMTTRRAHALRDPSTLEVGGSAGEHGAHVTCGPDVRVRNASAGARYEYLSQHPDYSKDVGWTFDVRAGFGASTITHVYEDPGAKGPSELSVREVDRMHFFGSGQGMLGWDAKIFAVRAGVGIFGISDVDGSRVRALYHPLPALELRIGRRTGLSLDLGFGAPPVAAVNRWYSLYSGLQYKREDGANVGVGALVMLGGELDNRSGFMVKAGYPLTNSVILGGFAMYETRIESSISWTAGVGATVLLDR